MRVLVYADGLAARMARDVNWARIRRGRAAAGSAYPPMVCPQTSAWWP